MVYTFGSWVVVTMGLQVLQLRKSKGVLMGVQLAP